MEWSRCPICDKQAPEDYEPPMCCSGFECGCMGLPTEPYVCSDECWDKLMQNNLPESTKNNPN